MSAKKIKNIFHDIGEAIWHLFLSGLIAILPVTLTLALFNMFFRLILGWLEPLRRFISPTILQTIPYAEVILVIIFIVCIGTLYNMFLLEHMVHTIEALVVRIPLVRPVYAGIKQLVNALGSQDKLGFKHVVFVEFPRKGLFSLGFLTSELATEFSPNTEKRYFNIFIPTTPNPTSGFCITASEDEITMTKLTRQEAMAMIISGGIIQPEQSAQ